MQLGFTRNYKKSTNKAVMYIHMQYIRLLFLEAA
jgi:hypothetical protein